MKKTLLTFLSLILLVPQVFGADISDFKRGDDSDVIKGTDNISDADTYLENYLSDPLRRALATYVNGCALTRTSATVITISVGEVVCSNGAGTIARFRQNTSTVTMTITTSGVGGLDTGSEASSTWYHIYADADADATTFTAIASTSASAPTGVTYYKYLGSVYNDSAGDLRNFYWFGYGNLALVMLDVPVNITTSVSAASWSSATSCAIAIPTTSTLAIFGLHSQEATAGSAGIWIRLNGSTWAGITEEENGIFS